MKLLITFLVLFYTTVAAQTICTADECSVSRKMTFWGFALYHLDYTMKKNGNEHLVLTYLRDIERAKNIDKGNEKFFQNNTDVSKTTKSMLDAWHSKYVDVVEGDKFEVIAENNQSVMKLNTQELIRFKGDTFAKMYLHIWNGPQSVDDDLQEELASAKKRLGL